MSVTLNKAQESISKKEKKIPLNLKEHKIESKTKEEKKRKEKKEKEPMANFDLTINNNTRATKSNTNNYDSSSNVTPNTIAMNKMTISRRFLVPAPNEEMKDALLGPGLVGFVVLILLIGWVIWRFYKEQTKQDIDRRLSTSIHMSTASAATTTTSNNRTTAALRLQLSLYDCIELYNKTFDTKENQTILQNKHIVTKIMKDNITTTTTKIVKREEDDEQNSSTIKSFIDIEVGDNNAGKDDDNDDADDVDDPSISLSVDSEFDTTTTTTTRILCLDHNEKSQTQILNGTCIICFEDFVKNDRIVWSNNSNCNHVYHKECMVHYLASNAQRNSASSGTLNVTDNPCPTCRRPHYCGTVLGEDVAQLLEKCVITTNTYPNHV